jgi:RNA polymerase sigma-70 factor (ECF subfamily)
MLTKNNSSQTNRLLQRVSNQEGQALDQLFARHRERLRKMIRLRLHHRVRGRFTSSTVLAEVEREGKRRIDEYLRNPRKSLFLWMRHLAGRQIQALHRQYLGPHFSDSGREISLHRGAMPEVNSVSLAAQLIGEKGVNQAAARADMLVRLEDALNSMDAFDREILAMCHFEELKDEEVAALLDIDKTTAMMHYVRALKRLKEILKSIPGFFELR